MIIVLAIPTLQGKRRRLKTTLSEILWHTRKCLSPFLPLIGLMNLLVFFKWQYLRHDLVGRQVAVLFIDDAV